MSFEALTFLLKAPSKSAVQKLFHRAYACRNNFELVSVSLADRRCSNS